MKILATSDIHGNKALIHLMLQVIKKKKVDTLIIAGDVTPKGFYKISKNDIQSTFNIKNRDYILDGTEQQIRTRLDLLGFIDISKDDLNLQTIISRQKEQLKQICSLIKTAGIPAYMLIGNDDHIPDRDWEMILDNYKIGNLSLMSHALEELKLVGFQFVLPTPWNTNNELPEEELARRLRHIEGTVDRNTIFVTHMPPKGVLDRLANGLSVGSESIYNLIINKKPIFHIFGHIHESFGSTMLDKTLCCNVSSLWDDWSLRGYIFDTTERAIEKIKVDLSISNLEDICSNISVKEVEDAKI